MSRSRNCIDLKIFPKRKGGMSDVLQPSIHNTVVPIHYCLAAKKASPAQLRNNHLGNSLQILLRTLTYEGYLILDKKIHRSVTTMRVEAVVLVVIFIVTEGAKYKDVEIESGLVRGYLAEDGDYFAYLGVPYASPPIGGRRFKAPFPAPYWNETFHANRVVKCPQNGEGNEDCLILNVFTPTKILNGPLPVLVYIHGGSFIIGSGQTKGMEHILRQNIIVVTLNYRLGALGFLCLGMNEAPGNAGLKDQVAALKWVRGNIECFGGDPKQVTVYGMSAGGASVEMLLLSDLAKELFHNAIIESGTATGVWAVDAHPLDTAFSLIKEYPKSKTNVPKLIDFYKTVPADLLSTRNYELYENLTDGTFGFVPCVERKVFGAPTFIESNPLDLIKNKKYTKVPILFIFAEQEGLYLRSEDYVTLNYKDKMNDNFEDFMPADFIFDTKEIKDEVTKNVRQFYFNDKPIDDNSLTDYLNYFGDYLVMNGLLNSAKEYSKDNVVYMMEFGYKGNLGSSDEKFDHLNVAGHGDAVKHVILNKMVKDNNDKLIVDRMVKIVANFMKYSNPIPTRTQLLPIHWPAVAPGNVTYLRMDKELQVLEDPLAERMRFWDVLYDKYRREIKPVDLKEV